MGKKTMHTHMCMFTRSALCLCRLSRCLCCVIGKHFLRQNILPDGSIACVKSPMTTPLGKSNCWKINSWRTAYILHWSLIVYFQSVLQRARLGDRMQFRTEKIQSKQRSLGLVRVGSIIWIGFWRETPNHPQDGLGLSQAIVCLKTRTLQEGE